MKKLLTIVAAALVAGSMMAGTTVVSKYNNGTYPVGSFSAKASDDSKVSLSYSTRYNANSTTCTAMTFASSISVSNNQPSDYYVKASVEGGFKKGDVVRIAPFTIMSNTDFTGNEKCGNIRVYADNVKVYESNASTSDKSAVTDGHEQAGDVKVHEFVLTADCDSICFGRTGNTRVNVLSFEVVRVDKSFYDFENCDTKPVAAGKDSTYENGVTARSGDSDKEGNLMQVKTVSRSFEGINFTQALYFAGKPGNTNGRYATVALDGPCTVTVYAMSSTNTVATRNFYVSAGTLNQETKVISHTTPDGQQQQIQKGTFVYNGTEATDLYFSVDGGFYLFGFEVAKQYFVTIHDGLATFCAPVDVVLPEALTAYAATNLYTDWINLEPMTLTDNKLAANTPVVLMSEEDATYTLDMTEGAVAYEGTNLLQGTVARTQNPGGVYCLNSTLGAFQQYTGEFIPANKAYLQNSNLSEASIRIVTTPGIMTPVVENVEAVAVKKMVVNGQICILRNGAKYNVAGKKIQ